MGKKPVSAEELLAETEFGPDWVPVNMREGETVAQASARFDAIQETIRAGKEAAAKETCLRSKPRGTGRLRAPRISCRRGYPQKNPLELKGLEKNAGMRVVFWLVFSFAFSLSLSFSS
jgi:hypothetical protein